MITEDLVSENGPDSILISDAVWNAIRHQFTEAEKSEIRGAICGEVICPKGIVIDRDKLNSSLSARITEEKRKLVSRGRRDRI